MTFIPTSRPRIQSATLVGKSGTKTLSEPTLVQDRKRRAEMAAKDKAAYLAKGGKQQPLYTPTAETALEEEIRTLFTCPDWATFSTC